MPIFPDDETTFEQLQERISKTLELLESADAQGFEGAEAREIVMKVPVGTFKFETGQHYLSHFALPNFHFHMSTVYCIMRHLGVPLTMFDYLKGAWEKQ